MVPLSPTLLFEYNFLPDTAPLRPYIGAGVNYTQFYDRNNTAIGNEASGGQSPHEGIIIGCSWVPGRWPGKNGLEFKRVSDRVRFHLPGEFSSLTLMAWVRVDALPHRFNSLLMTDGWDEAAPHWHISADGQLEQPNSHRIGYGIGDGRRGAIVGEFPDGFCIERSHTARGWYEDSLQLGDVGHRGHFVIS